MAGVGVGADWLLRPCMRPGCRTGVPARDYQFGNSSPVERTLSRDVVLLEIPSKKFGAQLAPSERRIKVFQMVEPKLHISHCSVSQLALQVDDQGTCILSLRAEQGIEPPRPIVPEALLSAESIDPQTSQVKRNLFVLRVRGFVFFPVAEADDATTTGKPVAFQLKPIRFWVQRGEPYDGRFVERSKDAKDYFELLDRVEVSFSFRTMRGVEY